MSERILLNLDQPGTNSSLDKRIKKQFFPLDNHNICGYQLGLQDDVTANLFQEVELYSAFRKDCTDVTAHHKNITRQASSTPHHETKQNTALAVGCQHKRGQRRAKILNSRRLRLELGYKRVTCKINNGRRTKRSPIRSLIIGVIDKIGRPRSRSSIC